MVHMTIVMTDGFGPASSSLVFTEARRPGLLLSVAVATLNIASLKVTCIPEIQGSMYTSM